ncbi:hypothetical protein GH741_07140 [Aquibacillus halophilus]|uniref:Uncharacterized protein n=1 Tax=Aquibacillus halophilus TaxID=930132 RepID=A0A6A8DHS8_9BACI|nr:DUF6123 family protein [Aquibacillus halophilus]MRH42457.1 hypothetical protein [Aquibacillus halophilus]
MRKIDQLGFYIEDLWSKGFKLTDEEVHFIYFGKNSTNAPEWKVKMAIKETLRVQYSFDRSFFLSLLESLNKETIKTRKEASTMLRHRGLP